MRVNLTVHGNRELCQKLKTSARPSDIKRVVRHNGVLLQQTMQRKAEFKGHFEWTDRGLEFVKPTGTTKRSIAYTIGEGGYSVRVAPETHYSQYLEYGTRFMSAQPFVKPALNDVAPKFIADLNRLVK